MIFAQVTTVLGSEGQPPEGPEAGVDSQGHQEAERLHVREM